MSLHRYNRHPTPDNPMVRLAKFHPDRKPEWVRDDGTDNMEAIQEQ